MPTLRPYSIRLARGTLLMLHPPTTSVRYARMERFIDIESIGLLCAGVFMTAVGWLGREVSISVAGIISLCAGGCSWMMRRFLLQRRRKHTPGMIFISDEGIGAILPNNSTTQLEWKGLRAREFRRQRGGLPHNIYVADDAMRGIVLKDASRKRLYLTHDLDGYNELLEILVDFEVPIRVSHAPILGARGGFTEWRRKLERRTWEERN